MSSAYASAAVRSGQPGTFEDDWIALAYTWYALSLGSFDRYEQQVLAGSRPTLAEMAPYVEFKSTENQLLPREENEKNTPTLFLLVCKWRFKSI